MKKKRIAIVCFEGPFNISGGVQRRIAEEVEHFSRLNIELTVLFSGGGNPVNQGNVVYYPIPVLPGLYPFKTLMFSVKVARLFKQWPQFDLVETHHDAGAVMLFSKIFGIKPSKVWIEVIHGVFLDEFLAALQYGKFFSKPTLQAFALAFLSIFEMLSTHFSSAVIVVSSYAAKRVHKLYLTTTRKIHIVPNGIDTELFYPDARSTQKGGTLGDTSRRSFLYVGRLDPRKGVIILLRAFAKAYAIDPNLELVIIGTGLQEDMVCEECLRLNMSNAIHLIGRRTDQEIIDAYHMAYAVCMPSFQEGQGIVALEAMACGVPVIATKVGGLAEIVLHRNTGILVPPKDIDAMAEAITEITRDGKFRAFLSGNAREWSLQYDWNFQLRNLKNCTGH